MWEPQGTASPDIDSDPDFDFATSKPPPLIQTIVTAVRDSDGETCCRFISHLCAAHYCAKPAVAITSYVHDISVHL